MARVSGECLDYVGKWFGKATRILGKQCGAWEEAARGGEAGKTGVCTPSNAVFTPSSIFHL